jgi:chromosome segregation ATPase
MEIMEGIRAALKELILPELDRIREENREIRAILEVTNKRLDDVNTHLADQSRRIDSLREELSNDIKGTNNRIDRLYEVIVRREEHQQVAMRLTDLEKEVREIKRQLAA